MNTLVVDTSVFVKWLNHDNEQYVVNADKILQEVRDGKTQIIVPELLKYELGNVLLKGKQLSPDQAIISLGTAYSVPVTFITQSEQLAIDTFTLAHTLNVSYYDASFMALAKQYQATLVTDNLKHQGEDADIKAVALNKY